MDDDAEASLTEPEVDFNDVKLLLAEHAGLESVGESDETYEEHEIADILAVS